MKKTILSSVILTAAIFTVSAMSNSVAIASCPLKSDGAAKSQEKQQMPEKCFKPMTPEEHAQMREAKKAEFEARLKLTEEQKAQLEKIKSDEKKALKTCRKNIKKEKEKLDALIEQEKDVRIESIKKFEAILNEKQKEEMKKLHEEMKAEREKFAPHNSCGCGCPGCKEHAPMKHRVHPKPHHSTDVMPSDAPAPDCAESPVK